MFPEPERRPTTELKSTPGMTGQLAARALALKGEREPAGNAADSPQEIESALRIRAALTVARSDQHEEPPPDAPRPPGTWIVRSLPRPPLVASMLQEPPSDELLTNDSLGG